tara:strand:- start:437 stop:541 length:105 start_codon:yes stop_codon:yes gene_type:complete
MAENIKLATKNKGAGYPNKKKVDFKLTKTNLGIE